MAASRTLASFLGLALVALLPACGPRYVAWNTALAETDCHASDVIVRKRKSDPNLILVTACGEALVYRCDASTCVPESLEPPDSTLPPANEPDPLAPGLGDPTAPEATPPDETPADEASDDPAPSDEPASDEPAADEPAPDEPASDEPAPDPADASPGTVPEPP